MGSRGLWGREARLARADSGLRDEFIEARDCDLGFSPLTNMMPVRRHGLSVAGDHFDILAAWVSVPIYSCTHLVSVTSLLARPRFDRSIHRPGPLPGLQSRSRAGRGWTGKDVSRANPSRGGGRTVPVIHDRPDRGSRYRQRGRSAAVSP